MALSHDEYMRRRDAAILLLGGACAKCGSTKDLQFDHVDPASKVFEITECCNSRQRLVRELAKCQLLCPIHHREKSIRDLGREPAKHGTVGMYSHYHCRCEDCRKARADWIMQYRLKNGRSDRPNWKPRQSARGTHGTHAAYRYCGPPKCEACKAAHAQHMRNYRA